MVTSNCGALMSRLVISPATSPDSVAFVIRIWVCCTRAASPAPLRSSTCILNPPVAPRPGTGGGGNTPRKPSGMLANWACKRPAIAIALRSGVVRSLNGSSMMNMTAAFGTLTKPLIERPGNATTLSTPDSVSAIFDICLTTASVRSSDEAFGSWAIATR